MSKSSNRGGIFLLSSVFKSVLFSDSKYISSQVIFKKILIKIDTGKVVFGWHILLLRLKSFFITSQI